MTSQPFFETQTGIPTRKFWIWMSIYLLVANFTRCYYYERWIAVETEREKPYVDAMGRQCQYNSTLSCDAFGAGLVWPLYWTSRVMFASTTWATIDPKTYNKGN